MFGPFLIICAVTLLECLLVYVFNPANLVIDMENLTFDVRMRHWRQSTRVPTDRIVIVYISQESIEHYMYRQQDAVGWPWPREFYGLMIDYLRHAGAEAILFDMLFEARSQVPEDDDPFIEAIRKSGNVYLAGMLRDAEPPKGKEPLEYLKHREQLVPHLSLPVSGSADVKYYSGKRFDLPHESFLGEWERTDSTVKLKSRTAAGVFNIIAHPDKDGVLRSYPLLAEYNGYKIPSLAVAALAHSRGESSVGFIGGRTLRIGKDIRADVDRRCRITLKFYPYNENEPQHWFACYHAHHLIEAGLRLKDGQPYAGPLNPEMFKGRIVLIGPSAPALFDHVATPVTPTQAGVDVHATALANLLADDYIRRLPRAWSLVMIVLFGIFGCLLFWKVRVVWSVALFFLLLSLQWGAAWLAFSWWNWWIEIVPQNLALLASLINCLFLHYRQKATIRRAFEQYVPPQVVREIVDDPSSLYRPGSRKVLTCMFMDFADFTKTSEKLPPEQVVELLKTYHTEATRLIFRTRGTLDKYVADAIVAFWGDPIYHEDHAWRACQSALDIVRSFQTLPSPIKLRARFGINTGEMIVGNMGSPYRFNYTVIGDEVNLASRLEGANKAFGTTIIISQATYLMVRDHVIAREIGPVRVVGKQQVVAIYELLAARHEATSEQLEMAQRFHLAWQEFRARRFDKARELFAVSADRDRLSKLCVARCEDLIRNPPPEDWEFIIELDTK